MSVRRFVGVNSREAMRQVRAALGDDALILSNRQIAEGVEILALADEEHGRLTGQAPYDPPTPVASQEAASSTKRLDGNALKASLSDEKPQADTQSLLDFAAFSERVLGEMQDLRTLLTGQTQGATAAAMQGEGTLDRLRGRLLKAGFGAHLVQELFEAPPVELFHAEDAEANAWIRRQLVARLQVLEDEAALLDAGGVFALLGPTGIGKTTTTAKLAARYVMRHGNAGVALVTTDSYRIGAHEQLRIYARLLGVEVHALEADAPLGDLLARLAQKRLVIIDTVGMSQRDQRLVSQVARLGESSHSAPARPVRRMLLLNAASHGDTLEEVVDTYQRASLAAGAPLYGAILTKVDEAPRLAAVLDIAIRHDLRLHYVSHGQQVPEDLRLADGNALIEQALDVSRDSAFAVEMPATQHASPSRRLQALSRGLLGQGRALAAALMTLRREISGFGRLEQAWPLLGYPLQQQQAQLSALLDPDRVSQQHARSERPHAMLWARPKAVSGSDWLMPALSLNVDGQLQALPWLAHRLPAGDEARLHWATEQLGVVWQLLPVCPSSATHAVLQAHSTPWLALAQGNTRVFADGERRALSELRGDAEALGALTCRYRGRATRLSLAWLPVTLANGTPLNAWFGGLSEAESGRQVAQRYWLAPRDAAPKQAVADFLSAQLVHDDLPVLTRRAWRCLAEANQDRIDPELKLFVAAGLAAVACRLEQERSAWAMDVRAQLMGLLGGRRSGTANVFLDALLHLFTARDAFQLVGSGQASSEEALR